MTNRARLDSKAASTAVPFVCLGLLFALFSASASTQITEPEVGRALPNAMRGAELAKATCAGCHGIDGRAVSPQIPNLAGQYPEYLAKQLRAFTAPAGTRSHRKSAVMTPIAAALTEQAVVDLAAYYSGRPPTFAAARSNKELLLGKGVFAEGNVSTGLPACVSCHRPDGSGIRPDFPRLAGQQPEYVEAQLRGWVSNRGGPAKLMSIIVPLMKFEEMTAVADYIAQLR